MRLDAYAWGLDLHKIDLLWADITGSELEMIGGATRILAKTGFFYIHYSCQPNLYRDQPSFQDIFYALPGQWAVIFRTRSDVLLANTERVKGEQINGYIKSIKNLCGS